MVQDLLRTGLDLMVGLVGLLVITRLIGPNQIGQLTPFHFISALVLGELVGNAIFEPETGPVLMVYALVSLLIVILEWIDRCTLISAASFRFAPMTVIHASQGSIL